MAQSLSASSDYGGGDRSEYHIQKYVQCLTMIFNPRIHGYSNFHLKPKLSFLMKNHKTDYIDECSDFYEFTLFITFHENSHYQNDHFKENPHKR